EEQNQTRVQLTPGKIGYRKLECTQAVQLTPLIRSAPAKDQISPWLDLLQSLPMARRRANSSLFPRR
ncbi:MAG: hypothetical protein ACREB3_08950, partial [Burkholderiales bacterium]